MAIDKEEKRLQREQARKQKQSDKLQRGIKKADERAGILDAMNARGTQTSEATTVLEPEVTPVNVSNQIPQSGISLVKAIDAAGGGFNELQEGIKDGKKANTEELSIQNDISAAANNLNAEVDEAEIQERTQNLPGSGATLASEMGKGEPTRPSAEQFYDADKIKMDIQRKAMDAYGNIPGVVMEKLQADDYYPNIRKDIAVGNWSGRYLGSQTIYAAAGMRLPLGLYDARKRALNEAAKEKQAALDKIMAIPETADAYQADFSKSFLEGLQPLLGKSGWDANMALRDPETRAYIARHQAKAREIANATKWADSLLAAYKDENQYVPDESKDLAIKIKYASIDNLQDILDGKSNMMSLFNEAMIYEDLTPDVMDMAKTFLKPDMLSQMPINLRTGDKYDKETFVNERNQFLMDMKSGLIGKKQFAEGAVKFFGGDYEQAIENMVKVKNGSQEQVEPLKKLFMSLMQEQIEIKYRDTSTDDIAAGQLALNRAKFQREIDQGNYFGVVNNNLNASNKDINNGKPFNQALAEVNAITDVTKKKAALKATMSMYFPGQSYQTDKDGRVYSFVPASNTLAIQPASPKDLSRGKIEGEYWDGKNWIKKTWNSPSEFANSPAKLRVNGMVVTPEQKSLWRDEVTPGGLYTKPIGSNVIQGFTNSSGVFETLKEDGSNLDKYLKSNSKRTLTQLVHQPFVRKDFVDPKTGLTQQTTEQLPGLIKDVYIDINGNEGQMIMNGLWGTQATKAAETVGDGSSSSGSSESMRF